MKAKAQGIEKNQILQRLLSGLALALGLAATVSSGALKAEGSANDSPKHLLVGTVDNYLPCSDEAGNNYEGLSIDVWRRIAENINTPYTIVSIPTFSQAVDAAAFGSIDLIASCHKITPERLELVEFSVPYTRDSLGMLSRKNNALKAGIGTRLIDDNVIKTSLITLLAISGLAAIGIARLERDFDGMSGFSGKRSIRFTKAWIMLLLGSGVDKLLHQNHRAHALILLASGIRILFLSILVGTTAALIFEDRKPLDASKISKTKLNKILSEGVAVNAGTKMHDWLTSQIEKHNLDQKSHSGILAVKRKGGLSEALNSSTVEHVVSDVSVLTQVLEKVDNPSNYWLSLEMPNKTPQAFIFGADLSPEIKRSINIALSTMNYSGDTTKLEAAWQKTSPKP